MRCAVSVLWSCALLAVTFGQQQAEIKEYNRHRQLLYGIQCYTGLGEDPSWLVDCGSEPVVIGDKTYTYDACSKYQVNGLIARACGIKALCVEAGADNQCRVDYTSNNAESIETCCCYADKCNAKEMSFEPAERLGELMLPKFPEDEVAEVRSGTAESAAAMGGRQSNQLMPASTEAPATEQPDRPVFLTGTPRPRQRNPLADEAMEESYDQQYDDTTSSPEATTTWTYVSRASYPADSPTPSSQGQGQQQLPTLFERLGSLEAVTDVEGVVDTALAAADNQSDGGMFGLSAGCAAQVRREFDCSSRLLSDVKLCFLQQPCHLPPDTYARLRQWGPQQLKCHDQAVRYADWDLELATRYRRVFEVNGDIERRGCFATDPCAPALDAMKQRAAQCSKEQTASARCVAEFSGAYCRMVAQMAGRLKQCGFTDDQVLVIIYNQRAHHFTLSERCLRLPSMSVQLTQAHKNQFIFPRRVAAGSNSQQQQQPSSASQQPAAAGNDDDQTIDETDKVLFIQRAQLTRLKGVSVDSTDSKPQQPVNVKASLPNADKLVMMGSATRAPQAWQQPPALDTKPTTPNPFRFRVLPDRVVFVKGDDEGDNNAAVPISLRIDAPADSDDTPSQPQQQSTPPPMRYVLPVQIQQDNSS